MAIAKAIRSLILVTSVFLACEERADIDILSARTDLIAVEAILTNENISHTVRLVLPYQKINGTSMPVRGAVVTISDGSAILHLTPADSGRYLTPKTRFVSGKKYTLEIHYQGKTFTASDESVAVESLSPLSYYVTKDGYRFNWSKSGTQANYIEYKIDWRGTPSCTNPTACMAKLMYYDLKTIDTNEIFKPAAVDFVFPPQSTIIRRKFSVSAEYRDFLRSMLSETQWRGSVFDVQRDNPPTNLSEGAIGFFTVSTVVSDTLKIQ
jgi:hypothetical protein